VKWLNLIPADKQALYELRKSLKDHKDNLGQDGDRVCVSLVGKTLRMKSKDPVLRFMNGKPYTPTYHLIRSSERINCRNLLRSWKRGSSRKGNYGSNPVRRTLDGRS